MGAEAGQGGHVVGREPVQPYGGAMVSVFRGSHEKPELTIEPFSPFLFGKNDQAGLIQRVQKAGK